MIPDIPSVLDQRPYDAPLTFPPPSKAWTQAKGGPANNRTETLTDTHVPPVDLSGKWVLLSGASSGIGLEAALTFARWGANLVLACRTPRALHEIHPTKVVERCLAEASLAGHNASVVEWWAYDAAELETVEALAQRYLATGRPLDILCNNTGIGSSPGGDHVFLTKDGFEIIHQVNFLSHVLLTLYLLPALAQTSAPRVVCTTSCFHYLGHYDIANFNGGPGLAGKEGVQYYQNNKLYFQIWLTELQHRLLLHEKYKHITVNGFHPGYVRSGIWNIARKGWFGWLLTLILMLLVRLFGIDVKQGSMGLVYVATAPECGPDCRTQGGQDERGRGGGRYFNRIWEDEPMPHCKDRDARLRVWRKVNDELKLREKGLLDVLGVYSGGEAEYK